jgi:hypothetical protein
MDTAEKPRHKRSDTSLPRNKIGWRVNQWAAETGTSRATVYRRLADGSLRSRKYGGLTLILGFAGDESAE